MVLSNNKSHKDLGLMWLSVVPSGSQCGRTAPFVSRSGASYMMAGRLATDGDRVERLSVSSIPWS